MIYLLEDDNSIRKLVIYALESTGYQVRGFELPSAFWKAMSVKRPELILLDIMLPEEDGMTILRRIRASGTASQLPVIMLTAKNTEYDRVIGLDSGADDFICKPFGMMELIARVRAVLRRFQPASAVKEYHVDNLYICPERRLVCVDGEDVVLTCKEFELLCLLAEHEGMVMTRNILMDKIWGADMERENRTLDVHIRTLRAKLGTAGGLIETVRGVGYRMRGKT